MQDSFVFNSMQLNSDLHVAGAFLYEGCFELDSLMHDSSQYEPRLFLSLYKIAIGIERLQKTILILGLNAHSESDLDCAEQNVLKGHSHVSLGNRLERLHPELALTKVHRRLLQCLTDFYKSCRYNYYHFSGDPELAALHIADYSKRKDEFQRANIYKKHSMVGELVESFAKGVSELISLYVDMVSDAKGRYFTDETEADSKFAVVKYNSNDVFAFFKLRRLAILEFAAWLDDLESGATFVEAVDVASFIRGITFNRSCSDLVDALTEYYQEEHDINLYDDRPFVEERIEELEYRLSPDRLFDGAIRQDDGSMSCVKSWA